MYANRKDSNMCNRNSIILRVYFNFVKKQYSVLVNFVDLIHLSRLVILAIVEPPLTKRVGTPVVRLGKGGIGWVVEQLKH